MSGGAWPLGPPTAAAAAVARCGGRRRRAVVTGAACGSAAIALAGWLLALRQQHDAGSAVQAVAAPAGRPVLADDTPAVRAAAVAPRPQPAPGRLSIRPLADGRLDVEAVGADRLQAITALADATGTRLYGVESLPRSSFGRVSVQLAGVDRGTAWQHLLDGAPVGFAAACERRSCAVWFAPAVATAADPAGAATAAAPGPAPMPRAGSSEGEN